MTENDRKDTWSALVFLLLVFVMPVTLTSYAWHVGWRAHRDCMLDAIRQDITAQELLEQCSSMP